MLYPEHFPPQTKVFKNLNAGDRPCLLQLNPGLTCHQHQFKLICHFFNGLFFGFGFVGFFLNYSLIEQEICCKYETHLEMVHLGWLRREKKPVSKICSQGVREKQGKLGVFQYGVICEELNSTVNSVLAMIFLFVSSPTHLFIYGIYELEVDLELSKCMIVF